MKQNLNPKIYWFFYTLFFVAWASYFQYKSYGFILFPILLPFGLIISTFLANLLKSKLLIVLITLLKLCYEFGGYIFWFKHFYEESLIIALIPLPIIFFFGLLVGVVRGKNPENEKAGAGIFSFAAVITGAIAAFAWTTVIF
tara:strand:- start:5 stop:430 length:426 start_codon:yes stop_codon:yes gene_type:complete